MRGRKAKKLTEGNLSTNEVREVRRLVAKYYRLDEELTATRKRLAALAERFGEGGPAVIAREANVDRQLVHYWRTLK